MRIVVFKDRNDKTTEHKYSHSGIYCYLGEVEVKDPETRKWYKAVEYMSLETNKRYIREYSDFMNKFEFLEK